jgi:major membrane immunogen (membrane-anchored lipoprotein)
MDSEEPPILTFIFTKLREGTMKRKLGLAGILVILGTGLAAAQTPADGFYFAQAPRYGSDGWRDQVVLEVKGGKISSANWNKIGLVAGAPDRKAWAQAGKDSSGWAAQAGKAEQFLVSSQNTNATAVDGVSVPVAPFFTLAKQALSAAPVGKGIYKKDGWFYGEAAAADSFQTKNTVLITVVNGTIVDVLWNGILQMQGVDPSKIITSTANKYPMNAPQGAWHVQATRAAQALVRLQDTAKIPVKADQKTDAITGVTIMVKDYVDTANRALQSAR